MTDTQRPRRSPTSAELRIWREFIETVEALSWRLASRLQSESSLSPGDYQVLLALSEADGHRMRSSELAAVVPGQVPEGVDAELDVVHPGLLNSGQQNL